MLADEVMYPNRTPQNNRLPTELMLKIFAISRGLPFMFNGDPAPSPDDFVLPFALAGVCRRWHEVAVDIPQLWNHIYLKGNKSFVARTLKAQVEAASRAEHLSLFLTAVLYDAEFLEACRSDDALLYGIENKVVGLDLVVPYDFERKKALDQNAADWMRRFTSLERLYLAEDFAFRDYPEKSMWAQLTHLHIQKSYHEDCKNILGLELPRLTSLTYEIDYRLILDLPTFFHGFPNLVELFLRVDELSVTSNATATHHKLERFILYDVLGFDDDPEYSFFTHASLPALKDLAIHASYPRNVKYVIPLLKTLRSSHVQLDRFTVMSRDLRREWKVFQRTRFFYKLNAAKDSSELEEVGCFEAETEEKIFEVLEAMNDFKTLKKKRVFGVLRQLGLVRTLQEIGDFSKLEEVGAQGGKKVVNELKDLRKMLDDMNELSEILRELKKNFKFGLVDFSKDFEEAAIFRESKARWYERSTTEGWVDWYAA